jgi:4-aminobutyrate aminotransferase-like enzyme
LGECPTDAPAAHYLKDGRHLNTIASQDESANGAHRRGGPVSIATAHTIIDGIKNYKLVFVAMNLADRLRQQTAKLAHFI